ALGDVRADPKIATPILIYGFLSERKDLQPACALALTKLNALSADPVRQLLDAVKDSDAGVRANAAWALRVAAVKPDMAVPALLVALKDPQAPVRRAAAKT